MKRLRIFIAIATALVAVPIIAQQSTDGPFTLHEYVRAANNDDPERSLPSPRSGRVPGSPPPLTMEAKEKEPILDPDGPKFDEDVPTPYGDLSPFGDANALDGRTDRVNSLNYFAQFEPSVIPYKRVVAQNKIEKNGNTYSLRVDSDNYQTVGIEQASANEDTFWASFLIKAEEVRLHPIPSVSPQQRIVEVQTEPATTVSIVRDSADNFFLKLASRGLVRVNLKISVPTYYFNGPFEPVEWQSFDRTKIPDIPSDVSYTASSIAKKIGATKDKTPVDVLTTMVAYFRDFEARPLTSDELNGDLYETISYNQVGVCRHRSLAFVITAQVLGIPARYVYNEAHAFVEIHWPGYGWRRIDLGGAADEMNAAIDDGRSLHNPGTDALPTPSRFIEEQDRMQQNFPQGQPSGNGGNNGGGDEGSVGTNNSVTSANGNGTNNLAESDVEPDNRLPARISIDRASTVVRRGDSISIATELRDEFGAPLTGRKVVAFIGPVGRTSRAEAVLLGDSKTDGYGNARIQVKIPDDHAIGRWELFVYFTGDETYAPAIGK